MTSFSQCFLPRLFGISTYTNQSIDEPKRASAFSSFRLLDSFLACSPQYITSTILYIIFYSSSSRGGGNVEKGDMHRSRSGCEENRLFIPSFVHQESWGQLTDGVNLPLMRELLTYPRLSTGNLALAGRTCTPSSTLWIAGGIVWAMAGLRHGCPHAPDARCVMQSLYRGFTHVVNRGGKGFGWGF